MLGIHHSATTAIAALTDAAGVAPHGGLRITLADHDPAKRFELSIAAHPTSEEHVVSSSRANVFLTPGAAEALTDKTLHGRRATGGRFSFSVTPQPSTVEWH